MKNQIVTGTASLLRHAGKIRYVYRVECDFDYIDVLYDAGEGIFLTALPFNKPYKPKG